MEDTISLMKSLKNLANILYNFYKEFWDLRNKDVEKEEVNFYNIYIKFQEEYAKAILPLINMLPHEISKRIYYDLIYNFMTIKHQLELIFLTQVYGIKIDIPEALKINLDEALEMPLKAFNVLIELFDVYDSKEKLKDKISELSRLEGLMDQSQLTLLRQMEAMKGKEDDFSLMIIYKILHSVESILDSLEDIGNYLSR